MLWIKYENQPPALPIENFDQLLIREEGSGILNFALDGARELLSLGGRIKLFPAQENRTDALPEDTDPFRLFIRECLVPEAGADVSQKELWTHFVTPIFFIKKSVFLLEIGKNNDKLSDIYQI